jgi:hypothetical protein
VLAAHSALMRAEEYSPEIIEEINKEINTALIHPKMQARIASECNYCHEKRRRGTDRDARPIASRKVCPCVVDNWA